MNKTWKLPSTSDYVLDEQFGYLLRLASQRHSLIFQDGMIGELTPTQYSTLMRLAEIGECSQNQLGRMVAMDVATTKGLVDRLRQKGLVGTRPSQTERRRSLVSLTENGERMLVRDRESGRELARETRAPLPGSEQSAFLHLLCKICWRGEATRPPAGVRQVAYSGCAGS